MTNSLLTIAVLLLASLSIIKASGFVEIVISSPKTVVIEPTICAEFACYGPDLQVPARKVHAGVPLRFHADRFHGPTLPNLTLVLKVIEPDSYVLLALRRFQPEADNEFVKMEFLVNTTDSGFNMTIEMRTQCSENFMGKRCENFCQPRNPIQSSCAPNGTLICNAGWKGVNCSEAICPNGCNGRGKCETPGKCVCMLGFSGPECDKCQPSVGCAHGTCKDNVPGTCACLPGFAGDLCDFDAKVCSTKKPCQNGGKCSYDERSKKGYRCDCPFDFLGLQCETPLSSVPCSPGSENLCQNGGACYTSKSQHIQCKCRPGFTGTFCEMGEHTDCSTKMCPNGSTCQMLHSRPVCIRKPTTPRMIPTRQEVLIKDQQQQAFDDMHRNLIFITCFLLIIFGLCFSCYFLYTRIIVKSFSRTPSSEDPAAPMANLSATSNPTVYKVCIVSEEHAGNASDTEHDRFYNSPPPAYSSPIMPRYQKIPTNSEPYRDCVV